MSHPSASVGRSSLGVTHATIASYIKRNSESNLALFDFWNQLKADRTPLVLSALIKADLQRRFDRGERPTATDYLDLFPELANDQARALSLIYEEYCLLEENEAAPRVSEFCERYDRWRYSLMSQLGYHRTFSQIAGRAQPKICFPLVGERFASYELRSVLGQGAAAQVYLATDDLGGRQVVLKVSASIGLEPSILARLEHRNIVPILTVAESPESGLRGICMPYRPGMTLESMMARFAKSGLPRRAVAVYDLLEVGRQDQDAIDSGWKDFPVKGTYTEAIAWVGLAIANALTYLHRKGIFHRDIKPANIMLAHREGPLLFDFNLAHTPNDPEQAQAALQGGTLPYMAPEQLQAFVDPTMWDSVEAPADIYALGMVLRELVTGQKPDLPRSDVPLNRVIHDLLDRRHELTGSLRTLRPEVPPSLDAIIQKCLALNTSDRYAAAADLVEDLRRFMRRRPLLIAANSSSFEVAFNWVYRQSRHLGLVSVLIVAFLSFFALRVRDQVGRGGKDDRGVSRSPRDASRSALPRVEPSHLPSFRRGVELLKSSNPVLLREAKEIFLGLTTTYPDQAEPWCYAGLASQKLNEANAEVGRLFGIACSKRNAGATIEQVLLENPVSAALRMSLGCCLIDRGPEAYPAARKLLNDAGRIQPNHYGVWETLGFLDEKDQQIHDAVAHYQRAITTALFKNETAESNGARLRLVPMLVKEMSRLLKADPDLATQRELRWISDLIEVQLTALQVSLATDPLNQPNGIRWCEYFYCRGTWISNQSHLNHLTGRLDHSGQGFAIAEDLLRRALLVEANANPDSVEHDQAKLIRSSAQHELNVLRERSRVARPAVEQPLKESL